jgi:hypothetical protein
MAREMSIARTNVQWNAFVAASVEDDIQQEVLKGGDGKRGREGDATSF